jgi:CubicO group peptidase (beta-lactamase class C family)
MSGGSRAQPSRAQSSQAQPERAQPERALPERALPARPSLRHLKLEAKRRLAAGEFATLNDAQAVIAREHGLPSWARLKQACAQASAAGDSTAGDGPALTHLRWIVERFSGADQPGWTPPGQDELSEHFDDRFLAAIPAAALTEAIAGIAGDLRTELVVIRQAPLEAQVQLAGQRYVAVADSVPPHRLIGLRGFVPGERITDPRLKAPRPSRTLGRPSDGALLARMGAIAARACAELGLPALLLAGGEPGRAPGGKPGRESGRAPGGEPGRAPWVVATGHADLDRDEPLQPGHRFPIPGATALVTGTAVLRLVADGRLGLDDPANHHLRAVSLADDAVTVRDLLSHTGGVDNPAELYADAVPELAELMGPVISCSGLRGTISPSNGGICVLGQLIADVTGQPFAEAATRLVLEPLGMRDSRFPAKAADIGPNAVTGYTATRDGALEPFPARVSTMPAVAGLWSAGADLIRLGTGWSSLLPAALARAALTPQAEPGPAGMGTGLGWLLDGRTAMHGGAGLEAVTLLRSRVRDRRTYVVLTSRAVTIESLDDSLRRAWLDA